MFGMCALNGIFDHQILNLNGIAAFDFWLFWAPSLPCPFAICFL